MKYIKGQSKKTMTCQAGATTGFPLRLSQQLEDNWPSTDNAQNKLKKIIVPTDFTLHPAASQKVSITVNQTPTLFQVSGLDSAANGTTLTYGSATYNCSPVLSIVQNQHPTFINSSYNALYEAILAFQINNKDQNPSSPDIILMCRPIIFGSWSSSSFWEAINTASKTPGTSTNTQLDMSTLFGWNSDYLLPMVTYETCLPVKLIDKGTTDKLTIRVNVCKNPVTINAGTDLQKCSSVTKYTLVTGNSGPASLFQATTLQFKDGLGPDGFPSGVRANLIPSATSGPLSAFTDVLQKLEILIPEAWLGKSLAEITDAKEPPKPVTQKKQFKCYTINPETDIKDDQILIDPTTGIPLKDTLQDMDSNVSLNLSELPSGSSGLMPGDIENILFIIAVTIGSLLLFAYLGYVAYLLFNKGDFHNGLYNGVIWVVLFIGLILFGVYIGDEVKPK